jgi:hypothetical protein
METLDNDERVVLNKVISQCVSINRVLRPSAAVLLFLLVASVRVNGANNEVRLTPSTGMPASVNPPIQTGVTVVFRSPAGWVARKDTVYKGTDFAIVFVRSQDAKARNPAVELKVLAHVPGKFAGSNVDLSDPETSVTAHDLSSPVWELRRNGSFETTKYGRLPVWRIMTPARSCFLVLVVRGKVAVNVSVSGAEIDRLTPYLRDLETVSRSIRFEAIKKERRDQGSGCKS